jgi:hypothetical protein
MTPESARGRLGDTALTVLAIAIVARVVWELLEPLMPLLLAVIFIGLIISCIVKGR